VAVNASPKLSFAKRDRRRYRLQNENVDKKYVVVVSGSLGLQKTELQDLQLGVVMYA